MANSPSPLVSVVIANWNGRALLRECLQGLERQTYDRFEIIVVDNGSRDGSREMIEKEWHGRVKLITNAQNLGYAYAVNQGIRSASSDYIATLNNDAVAEPAWIAALVEAAERDPRVGMVASMVYDFKTPGMIDGTGLLLYPDGSSRGRGRMEKDRGQYDAETEALLPSGCAALYRRKMLDEVGLHDESFFAYCEDTDLGLRARLGGWTCAFAPRAVVRHHGSASTGNFSETKAFLVERNRLWVAAKSFPLWRLAVSPLYTLARFAWHGWAVLTQRGSAGQFARESSVARLFWILLRAEAAGIMGLPRALRARGGVRVAVHRREINRWFSHHGLSARELALKE